jgi:hypothetical protein
MYVFVFFSRACCFPMQVNKTLTSLNLRNNYKLGPQGGKAIAQSLEVTFHVQCHNLSLITSKLIFFFHPLNRVGEYNADHPHLVQEQSWPGGRKSDRQIASGDISILLSALSP